MKFFSGFALKNDRYLCEKYLIDSEFNVAGLSFGAIKAVEYALNCTSRIDTIQLFSPAFFQEKSEKFKRTQLLYFSKDSTLYIDNFLKNCFYPSSVDDKIEMNSAKKDDLEKLLKYNFSKEALDTLNQRGIRIEVYLGFEDKIVDTKRASEFFIINCDIFWLQKVGHFLC